MFYPEFTKEYIHRVLTDPMRYAGDADHRISSSREERRLYHGTIVPMTYQGFFLTPADVAVFRTMIETMVSIGRKMTDAYVKNPAYRRGFHFDPSIEELILIDPGYDIPVLVGRYDIFYNGNGEYRFCELNTDGSSAMNEDRVLGNLLADSLIFQDMRDQWKISRFELFDSLVAKFLARYRSIRGREARSVAIVDLLDKGTGIEFQVYRDRFAAAGVEAMVCDVRRMHYRDGKLWGSDAETGKEAPVDLVYRRMVTSDFVGIREEASDFEAAYRDGAFLSFGSFRSQVMHAKTTFSMMHDPQTKAIVTPEEWAFIQEHVPFTKELATSQDVEEVLQNKDRYILKPYNSYASQGILVGRDYSHAAWKEQIQALPLDQYIYQDYVDVSPTPFLVLKSDAECGTSHPLQGAIKELLSREDRLKMADSPFRVEPFGHVLGCFLFDEAFSGCYVRIGQTHIISGLRDYYTAPTFVAEPR